MDKNMDQSIPRLGELMAEELESTIAESKTNEKEEKLDQKFIVIVDDPTEGVVFQVNGLDMNEALILILKGKVKFLKLHDKWLDDQV